MFQSRAICFRNWFVASIHILVGKSYGALGEFTKQLGMLGRALEIQEREYGREHPTLAVTLAGLANAYATLFIEKFGSIL